MDVPYKTLEEILAGKPPGGFGVSPDTSVLNALQIMAEKGVGLLLVLEDNKLAGVVSERDYARKVELWGKTARDTFARDIMTRNVCTVTLGHTVPQCMALMNEKGIRHLPVMEGEKVLGVLSTRDLVKEVVRHHELVIRDLEMERMITLNPDPSSY